MGPDPSWWLTFLLSSLVLFAWALVEGAIHARNRRGRTRPASGRSQDRGSGAVILVATLVGFLATWGSVSMGLGLLPSYALFVGLAIMLVGIAFRSWALIVLGHHFSPVVRTSTDQVIIREGPYQLVRHPAYTGLLLIAVGYPVLVMSGVGAIVAAVLFSLGLGYRMMVEDAALSARFGKAYDDYRASTPRIIPYLI